MIPTAPVTSFRKETPPQYEAKDRKLIVNYNLTMPEWLYLAWQRPCIKTSLKCTFIFLGASEMMQEQFNKVVQDLAQGYAFTNEEKNLNQIVASICSKTKSVVLDKLTIELKTAELADEKRQIEAANTWYAQNLAGHPGSMCTRRQANFMLEFFELSFANAQKEMASSRQPTGK